MLRTLLLHFTAYLFAVAPAFGATECRSIFEDEMTDIRVLTNDFNTDRTMADYKEVFYTQLSPLLKRLQGPENVWIDMGAGSAAAQISFLGRKNYFKGLESLPRLKAVAYRYPGKPERLQNIEKKFGGAFQYIEGKQTPETIREMDKADLITDVVGIATYYEKPNADYSESALEITKAYIDILKPSGTLLIHPYMNRPEQFPVEYLNQIDFKVIEILEGGQSLMITKKNQ